LIFLFFILIKKIFNNIYNFLLIYFKK